MNRIFVAVMVAGCGSESSTRVDGSIVGTGDGASDGQGSSIDGNGQVGPGHTLAGCPMLPADHVFNTRIDGMPVHASSTAFINTIGGGVHLHLDLGQIVDQTDPDFFGIPHNLVAGNGLTWP